MNADEVVKELAHELDVAWIIFLYLQIHGGDPIERENPLTVLIARALVTQISERYPRLSKDPGSALERLSQLGISVKGKFQGEEGKETEVDLRSPKDLRRFADTLIEQGWFLMPSRPGTICLYSKGFGMWCHMWYAATPPPKAPPGKSSS